VSDGSRERERERREMGPQLCGEKRERATSLGFLEESVLPFPSTHPSYTKWPLLVPRLLPVWQRYVSLRSTPVLSCFSRAKIVRKSPMSGCLVFSLLRPPMAQLLCKD